MATTDTRPSDAGPPASSADPAPTVFRAAPLVTLVGIAFFALCLSPIAFQGNWWFLLFMIPLALAWWLVRTRTVVDGAGVRIQGAWRTTRLGWDDVATLRLVDRGWVRAVRTGDAGAEVTLTGVRVRDLARVGDASGGRIRVPSQAEAEDAAEHRRELEAAQMRIAALRENGALAAEGSEEDAAGVEGAGTARTPDEDEPGAQR